MKRILSLIVIGVIGYFGYNYYIDNKVEETPVESSEKHIKITNKCDVPISYALFEWPKWDNVPTKHGVLDRGKSKEWDKWDVPIGEYMWYGIVTGDNNDKGGLWDYEWPGTAEVVAPFQLGFKLWHDGDLDWYDISHMDKERLDSCFGKEYTYIETGKFSWNGTTLSHHHYEGGPNWYQEPDTMGQSVLDSIWRVSHPEDTLTSTPLKCKKSN